MGARLCLLWLLVWFLCFRFDALSGLGPLCELGFCVFLCSELHRDPVCNWVAVGVLWAPPPPTPPPTPGGLLCRPFLGGGPGVGLTLYCFVVYSTRRFVGCLSLCHFVLVFFSPFSIAITALREERANLSAFRTFVRFVLV